MPLINGYPIKQYVTGYIKLAWAPDVHQEGLFSPGNIVRYEYRAKAIARLAHSCTVHGLKQISFECLWSMGSSLETARKTIRGLQYCGNKHIQSGSVRVWNWSSYEGRTDLYVIKEGILTALRYRDENLDPIVRPFAEAMGGWQFHSDVEDNARAYTARACKDYLNRIGVMSWPARPPDLNPREHVWDRWSYI